MLMIKMMMIGAHSLEALFIAETKGCNKFVS